VPCTQLPPFALWEDDQIRQEVRIFQLQHRWIFPLRGDEPDEDLVQECLLHWTRMRVFYEGRDDASLKTFLKTVVGNKLKDLRRAALTDRAKAERTSVSLEARPRRRDGEAAASLRETLSDPNPDLLEQAIRVAREDALHRHLDQLSETERRLAQGLGEGLSTSELARREGIARTTLEHRLRQLKERLRATDLRYFVD
jgi:RNA polymerase sigma factor (sigma-70 family)